MKLTPLKVEMLMALQYSPNFAKTFPHLDSPAQQRALVEFKACELIEIINGNYSLAQRGKVLVNKILATTLPEKVWV